MEKAKKAMRLKTRDAAFVYRMGAGFAGDVNRTHPASIEPALQCVATPATAYGQAVVADTAGGTNTVRPFAAGDSGVTIAYGVTVRPYPIQASSGSNFGAAAFGSATPPTTGQIDVLRSGYIMAQLNTGEASPTKGGTVYVRTAATAGNHVQGGFETTADPGNQAVLDGRFTYNGPADSNGVVEIAFNV